MTADRPPVSGEPRTEHGKRILREWLSLRPDHPPNTALIRDWIIEAEAEASTGAALPFSVLRLAEAIDDHNLWMGGLEDHGEGVGCSTDCAGDIYARLAEQEGAGS